MIKSVFLASFLLAILCVSCARAPTEIEPAPVIAKHPKELYREKRFPITLPKDFSQNPFPQLSPKEIAQEWGKEYFIAQKFAEDFDLYRSITNFKRALYLIPDHEKERKIEVLYQMSLAYFLGRKYGEVVYTVEHSQLKEVKSTFPAYRDLLLILYESYHQLGNELKAQTVLKRIEEELPPVAEKLALCAALQVADFKALEKESEKRPYIGKILENYKKEAKSVRKAELLNACLPGAGYWYLGQKQTAVTALAVNSLFTGSAAFFLLTGNIPAAILTLTFEGGWYFGGIYGAGLSAKHFNEQIYSDYANKIYKKEECLPSSMLKYSF